MNHRNLLLIVFVLTTQLNLGCGFFRSSRNEIEMSTIDAGDDNISIADEIAVPPDQPMVGNDRDEHGCIGSAGYTWSNLKNRCIQLFSEGIKLIPAGPNASNDLTTLILNSFLVFSNDQMHAELYLPNQKSPILFHKTSSENNESKWIADTYEIKYQDNKYTVYQFSLPFLSQE